MRNNPSTVNQIVTREVLQLGKEEDGSGLLLGYVNNNFKLNDTDSVELELIDRYINHIEVMCPDISCDQEKKILRGLAIFSLLIALITISSDKGAVVAQMKMHLQEFLCSLKDDANIDVKAFCFERIVIFYCNNIMDVKEFPEDFIDTGFKNLLSAVQNPNIVLCQRIGVYNSLVVIVRNFKNLKVLKERESVIPKLYETLCALKAVPPLLSFSNRMQPILYCAGLFFMIGAMQVIFGCFLTNIYSILQELQADPQKIQVLSEFLEHRVIYTPVVGTPILLPTLEGVPKMPPFISSISEINAYQEALRFLDRSHTELAAILGVFFITVGIQGLLVYCSIKMFNRQPDEISRITTWISPPPKDTVYTGTSKKCNL